MPADPIAATLQAALPSVQANAEIGPPLVDLVFDQPAATDAHLVFGATYMAPRDDIRLSAVLPTPSVAIKFLPPARAELLASLPGLTVRSLVLRPSVPLNLGTGEGASLPGVVLAGETTFPTPSGRRSDSRGKGGKSPTGPRVVQPRASRTRWPHATAGRTDGSARRVRSKASSTGCLPYWCRRHSVA